MITRWCLTALGILMVALAEMTTASAQGRRVALVIGNGAYLHTPALSNPRNDAEDLAAALGFLGFDITIGLDLDKTGMDRTIRSFADKLAGAELGLFYYAGHGIQVAGSNYLVPTDAQLSTAAALDFEMVRLDVVQRAMESQTQTNVILLDACRDNPLARNLARSLGTRSASIGRGLAQAEAGVGTLISYSTQPGNVALDGSGRNSPYAASLVRRITIPGEDLTSILIGVRNDVIKATDSRQVPWDQHALRQKLFLVGKSSQVETPPGAIQIFSEAALAWARLEGSKDIRDYAAFRKQYGGANAFYDRQAERQIERLKNESKQATLSTSPDTNSITKDGAQFPFAMPQAPPGSWPGEASQVDFTRPGHRSGGIAWNTNIIVMPTPVPRFTFEVYYTRRDGGLSPVTKPDGPLVAQSFSLTLYDRVANPIKSNRVVTCMLSESEKGKVAVIDQWMIVKLPTETDLTGETQRSALSSTVRGGDGMTCRSAISSILTGLNEAR